MIHRINIFLLSLLVALAPNFIFMQLANATTVAGEGWSVTKRLVQGATTFYDGAKNVVLNGKNYAATGTAAITPTASQVSKMIVRTGAVVAVDLAIKALIGAVDYVMDPANNQVTYREVKDGQAIYYINVSSPGWDANFKFTSVVAACNAYVSIYNSSVSAAYLTLVSTTQTSCIVDQYRKSDDALIAKDYSITVSVISGVPTEEKHLPYDAVASQVISDAVANKAEGKAYVSSVADTALEEDEQKQLVPAQDVINQLEYNKTIPTTETAQGQSTPQADPNDPTAPKAPPTDISLNFPVFCEWAPTVCQAANAAINFPKLFVEKFQKWDDWLNRETKPYTADETKIDTEDKRTFDFSVFNANRFSVDDKCPTPEPQTISVLGVTTSFSLSLQPVCSILELAKPALIACSYIYAAYIVIGAAKGG
ncbi:TPA: virulence factor TspB C-terminal domain-related protein [Acinetobacter baumannii]